MNSGLTYGPTYDLTGSKFQNFCIFILMSRYLLFFILSMFLFSCKKKNSIASLRETHWNLFYRNNNTFTFYALSEIYFKANDSVENERNFDTLRGAWTQSEDNMAIYFDNGDEYTGKLITNDSLAGTLTASGNHGDWYAKKQ